MYAVSASGIIGSVLLLTLLACNLWKSIAAVFISNFSLPVTAVY